MTTNRKATATAHPNIALAKYWGKLDGPGNVPAVPSLSLTLGGMRTTTTVALGEPGSADRLLLDGQPGGPRATARVTQLLDLLGGVDRPSAYVESDNDFPTAAGLASSASAFAALAVAANEAFEARRSSAELSVIARRVSASAGRSLFSGFVELPGGPGTDADLPARKVAPPAHWDLSMVVAVTTKARKAIGSTEGMNHTARTSPLYSAWLEAAPRLFSRVKQAVLDRDLERLGDAAEQSALMMHGTAMAAAPGLLYWNSMTIRLVEEIRRWRADGLAAYFTIDAGPHVKVLTLPEDANEVQRRLASTAGVVGTIKTTPGGAATLIGPPARQVRA